MVIPSTQLIKTQPSPSHHYRHFCYHHLHILHTITTNISSHHAASLSFCTPFTPPPDSLIHVFHITYVIISVATDSFLSHALQLTSLSPPLLSHIGRGGRNGRSPVTTTNTLYITPYTASSDTRTQEADESILTTKLA